MDAVESLGLLSDQRVFALNSYENRVYQVGIDEGTPIIAKFYRPDRWSDAAIQEEHDFSQALLDAEIDVVAPTRMDGRSLFEYGGFRFTLFPRQGGYAPEVDQADTLFRIGRNIGRMHQLAQSQAFEHRRALSIEVWAHESRAFLLDQRFIPDGLREAYESLTRDLISRMETIWNSRQWPFIRLHGDCHLGNILWRDDRGVFVDFDDCIMGPAIQDLWLMLSGDRPQQTAQLQELIEGYEEFCEFDISQLALIETLRTLRMMFYAAWLARRWDDPAFPMHFPWFNTERYWSSHILELREQLAALDEEPLRLTPW